MHHTEAREHLLQLLKAEGQEPGRLDLLTTWRVFGRFMGIPLEDVEEDGMRYEYLTASFGGPRRFILSFCRQFSVLEKAEEDDVAIYTQLTCEFEYEPTPELEALDSDHEWWFNEEGHAPLSDTLSWIEARPEWSMITKYPPVATSVYDMDPC
jgi:hypothetical protein